MPPEIVLIVVMSLMAGTFFLSSLVKQIFAYLRERNAPSADDGLSTAELEAILRRVVEETIAPLDDRLDALEAHLDAPTLLNAPRAILVDDEPEAEETIPARRRRRTR